MRSLANVIRMQKWKLDEQRRVVGDLQEMASNYQGQLDALEEEFEREKLLAANDADAGFLFADYATAARLRKQNLNATISELQVKLDEAQSVMAEQFQELKKFEISEETRMRKLKEAEDKRQQDEVDAFSIEMFRRKNK